MMPVWSRLMDVVEHAGERPALEVDGVVLSYRDLFERAAAVGATLADAGARTAILGHRTAEGYAGVLGTVLRGAAYVPLAPAAPAAHSAERLAAAQCDSVIVDRTGRAQLDDLLRAADRELVVLLLDGSDAAGTAEVRARHPRHAVLGAGDLRPAVGFAPIPHPPDREFQILFTSGTTGVPKAVRTTVDGMEAFLAFVLGVYDLGAGDRCSQLFDLAWDPHGFDLWVTWSSGACLVVPTREQLLFPARFVTEARLTLWYGVPSTGLTMQQQRGLGPGAFPGLRWALLCGEALPVQVAAAMQAAAPNAQVHNCYGPTEANITCMLYAWDPRRSADEAENGVVPIGNPHPGTEVRVVDGDLREVAPGEVGELLIGGAQLAEGYLNDPVRTAEAFVAVPGGGRWYRTGDRVRRPAPGRPHTYLGRRDSQVQVSGARIEIGEVEARLRRAPGVGDLAVVPWPVDGEVVLGLTAFVTGRDLDPAALRRWARAELPSHLVPRRIHVVDALPRTASGKTDRRALVRRLQEDAGRG